MLLKILLHFDKNIILILQIAKIYYLREILVLEKPLCLTVLQMNETFAFERGGERY